MSAPRAPVVRWSALAFCALAGEDVWAGGGVGKGRLLQWGSMLSAAHAICQVLLPRRRSSTCVPRSPLTCTHISIQSCRTHIFDHMLKTRICLQGILTHTHTHQCSLKKSKHNTQTNRHICSYLGWKLPAEGTTSFNSCLKDIYIRSFPFFSLLTFCLLSFHYSQLILRAQEADTGYLKIPSKLTWLLHDYCDIFG